jgi:polysaccharide biosynthesis protein PelG
MLERRVIMAGIGFALRTLVKRDNLHGVITAFGHSTFAAAGPWLFTVLALALISVFNNSHMGQSTVEQFRLIIAYSNCFAIICASPIVIVASRYLSDKIYEKKPEEVPGLLLVSLIIVIGMCFIICMPFYGVYFNLSPAVRVGAIINFCLIGSMAVIGSFLTAIKDYTTVSLVFLIGMGGSLLGATFLSNYLQMTGLLLGYNIGLTLILYVLVAKILAEFPYTFRWPQKFLSYFGEHNYLWAGALIYNCAAWSDKWVMWAFAPETRVFPTGMIAYPIYDSSMFLSFLSILPAVAIFTVILESQFYEKYVDYYRDIAEHASLERIESSHTKLITSLSKTAKDMFLLQAAISISFILLSPYLVGLLGMNYTQIGIFRVGTLGALFHIIFLYICIILIYFDMKKTVFQLNIVLLITNLSFSFVSVKLGFPAYGYGYFMATLVSVMVAYIVILDVLKKMTYYTFIGNNPAVIENKAFFRVD